MFVCFLVRWVVHAERGRSVCDLITNLSNLFLTSFNILTSQIDSELSSASLMALDLL